MKKYITKKLLMATIIGCFNVFIITGCSNSNTQTTAQTQTTIIQSENTSTEMLKLTIEELAKYDGKNGNKAYVAVDGVVYDFTPLSGWKDGEHNGFKAGTDLSEEILKAPHGNKTLERATIVGEITE